MRNLGLIMALCLVLMSTPSFSQSAPDPKLAAAIDEGKSKFDENCAACHGADLQGDKGPMLAENPNVEDAPALLHQVILGGGFMPSFALLNNRTIAAIATYVRNTHGNSYGLVTLQDVAAARKAAQ
jgi:mono/diheme cytochrome c family protein